MHRGGGVDDELLAISPPPEFQDSPAPPPAVFRDLSPAPRLQQGNQVPREGQLTSVKIQRLRDFADRVSFDILNEAMVIATEEVLLSNQHGGCTSNCSESAPVDRQFSVNTTSFPFSSDSSDDEESNPLSTTTSWEYLSKANSWSDLRCLRSTALQQQPCVHNFSPRHQRNRICKDKIPGTRNICLDDSSCINNHHDPVSFHNETPSHHSQIIRSASFHIEQPLISNLNGVLHIKRNNNTYQERTLSVNKSVTKGSQDSSTEDDSLCYNVPFQCDIYSVPIDSISSANELNQKRPPVVASPSVRCGVRVRAVHSNRVKLYRSKEADVLFTALPRNNELLRGQSEASSSSISVCSDVRSTNLHGRQKSLIKPAISLDSSHVSRSGSNAQINVSKSERNIDGVDPQRPVVETDWKTSTRRSRSVEMSISLTSVNCYQKNSSQNSIFSKESVVALRDPRDTNVKPEKRTIGHSILNLFKRNRPRYKTEHLLTSDMTLSHSNTNNFCEGSNNTVNAQCRALPPTPSLTAAEPSVQISTTFPNDLELPWTEIKPAPVSVEARDFAASIEKVKDCGWYWGPLSSEAAEDLLRGEPDGSFIVRDSSDAHYIFSLTFKLNGLVRHVRIEHDQGNFSFGPLTRFKASTIVDFVEKAVAHSRSGRYLFFLHRRPVLGPMRVQLLHPYSRYRQSRSLQHMCRFVILKYVRRDLIHTLPLPKPLQDYLNTPHYYFELPDQKKTES